MTGTPLHFQLAGRLTLAVEDLDAAQLRVARVELDPFEATSPVGAADVVLTARRVEASRNAEVQGPANDATTTALEHEGEFMVLAGGRTCTVPAPPRPGAGAMRIGVERGFPLRAAWAPVIRPAMQLALHGTGACAAHAAAVEDAGRAILVAGWSESGKTEVALALVEAGATFVSDKWTVVGDDGEASAFPVSVGVRGWVLPALPRLRAALPRRARVQLAAAGATGRIVAPFAARGPRTRLGGLAATAVARAVALGDRAGLSPSDLRAAYDQRDDPARRLAVGTVVLLVTSRDDRVTVEEADPSWAARRLARTAAYERRAFAELQARAAYAGAEGRTEAWFEAVRREEELLGRALARAERVLRVTCPFPGDPRRVVEALRAAA